MFCKGGTCTVPIFVFKVARDGERTKITGSDRPLRRKIMNIICKNRGMGKTHDIVKIACEKGYTILCLNKHQEGCFKREAIRQGFDIANLKTVIYNEKMALDDSKMYLIDETENFLTRILGVSIDTLSINRENVINRFNNDDIIFGDISYLLDVYSQEIKKPNCDFGKTYNILKNIDMLRGQLSKE